MSDESRYGVCRNRSAKDAVKQDRRAVPPRPDHPHTKGSVAHVLWIDWRPAGRGREYPNPMLPQAQ
jgi:hypothetical protein